MAFLTTMGIIGSGLTAQQTRLDVISENITNLNTTRTENGEGPYCRKVVVMESESDKNTFRMAMDRAMRRSDRYASFGYGERHYAVPSREALSNRGYETAGGVHISEIIEDETPFPFVYDPSHPDANEAGYVELPNITLVKEVADAMSASQAFNANVTAFNTFKEVVARGMDVGAN